jgi:hypothetical protein
MPDDDEDNEYPDGQDSWEDYDSQVMFPGCDCDHDATDHNPAWGGDPNDEGCLIEGCPCPVEWEHT